MDWTTFLFSLGLQTFILLLDDRQSNAYIVHRSNRTRIPAQKVRDNNDNTSVTNPPPVSQLLPMTATLAHSTDSKMPSSKCPNLQNASTCVIKNISIDSNEDLPVKSVPSK